MLRQKDRSYPSSEISNTDGFKDEAAQVCTEYIPKADIPQNSL